MAVEQEFRPKDQLIQAIAPQSGGPFEELGRVQPAEVLTHTNGATSEQHAIPPSGDIFETSLDAKPLSVSISTKTESAKSIQSKDEYTTPHILVEAKAEITTSSNNITPENSSWTRRLKEKSPFSKNSKKDYGFITYQDDPELKPGHVSKIVKERMHKPKDVDKLVEKKRKTGEPVHIIIPTLNEGTQPPEIDSETGDTLVKINVADTIREMIPLVEAGLVDDITIIDSNSIDDTKERVEELMREYNIYEDPVTKEIKTRDWIKFVSASDVLDYYGVRYRKVNKAKRVLEKIGTNERTEIEGKGANLWAASMLYNGILAFVDADFGARASQVQGILSALLTNKKTGLSLSMFKRFTKQGHAELKTKAQGARATRLTWRPSVETYIKGAVGLVDPIAGLYAVRSSFAQEIEHPAKYGIETAFVINALIKSKRGILRRNKHILKQVFTGVKTQVGQNAEGLGAMSAQIVHEFTHQLKKLGIIKIKKGFFNENEILHSFVDVTDDNDIIVEENKIPADRLPAPKILLAQRGRYPLEEYSLAA